MKCTPHLEVTGFITITFSEEEARALDALAGYDMDSFLRIFYAELGKHYMEPHENGMRSVFKDIREVVVPYLAKIDRARKAIE